jgi:hypothetical protein
VLTALAPHLPPDLLPKALAAAASITGHSCRADALTALAFRLPDADRSAVLVQALAAATAITSDSSCADALSVLAYHLPEPDRLAVLARAVTAAIAITDTSSRTDTLARLAPHLPPDLLAQTLAATITRDSVSPWALTTLAPHLPPRLLGAQAHAEFDILVIGVAKSRFRTATHAAPVVRGSSVCPLFVTAGMPRDGRVAAADLVRRMTGRYRLPDALRRADTLARAGPPAAP